MLPMTSLRLKYPGIGLELLRKRLASAGDFSGKLRVKWFWLMVCFSLSLRLLDFLSSVALRLRPTAKGDLNGQLVDFPREPDGNS